MTGPEIGAMVTVPRVIYVVTLGGLRAPLLLTAEQLADRRCLDEIDAERVDKFEWTYTYDDGYVWKAAP